MNLGKRPLSILVLSWLYIADQLGIKALRAGPRGNEKDSNHANYDEAKANPYGDLPDALTLKSGQKVTSAERAAMIGKAHLRALWSLI